jgi:hypothetical protein
MTIWFGGGKTQWVAGLKDGHYMTEKPKRHAVIHLGWTHGVGMTDFCCVLLLAYED